MNNWLVITGGSRGIGEKTIAKFQQQGFKALNLSRTACSLPNVKHISVDLSQTTWQQAVADELDKTVSNADKICLVHNAALFPVDKIGEMDAAELQSALNVNLIAPVILNNILIPHMRPDSSIVYIGSTLSEMAVAGRASYVITKHATIGMMRATCQDLVGKYVHTCCICPGFVNTSMLREAVPDDVLDQLIKSKVIAGRLLEPGEIAEFIYFAAMHPMVNGSVLHANLGQVMS